MKTNNLLRRVASTIREMNDAVRLSTEFRLSRGLGFGDEPPATYAEFLLRTSATSVHEPSAARRQRRLGAMAVPTTDPAAAS
jgi:hypothetical protein